MAPPAPLLPTGTPFPPGPPPALCPTSIYIDSNAPDVQTIGSDNSVSGSGHHHDDNAIAPPALLLPAGNPFPSVPPPTLSPTSIYIGSNPPDVSVMVRSQGVDHTFGAEDSELDDENRTMFINVRYDDARSMDLAQMC